MAARFDSTIVRTPAVRLVGERLQEALSSYDGRLVISVPPQELKTTSLRWAMFRVLLADPDRRIIFVSYSALLARQSGRATRGLVDTFGARYGLVLDRSHHDASDWTLAGHEGGVVSAGVGGSITGRPGDVLIIDDPVRNQQDADSETVRETIREFYTAVGRTRLAPGSPIVEVQTRWTKHDLAGDLIADGWPLVNIPALADGQTEDALGREAGEYLESTRGRTADDWRAIRRDVGERVWGALYQGRPAPLEGGIFQRSWFDDHRVGVPGRPEVPELAEVAVGVDPADTGTGDEAGVLVAGRDHGGHLYLLSDLSGPLSQAKWARRAALAWLRHDAARIVQERNLGMRSSIPDAWAMIRRQCTALDAAAGDVAVAAATLAVAGDDAAADAEQLTELVEHYREVLERPTTGPRVESVTPKQSKLVRAQSITGLFETGRAHIVGTLAELEHEACTWQPGQASPNRIDTMAVLLTRLDVAREPATASRAQAPRGGGGLPTRTTSNPRRSGTTRTGARPTNRR